MVNRICNNAKSKLKLNESLSSDGRYIMEGVFAELGVINVNHRIYTEEEYLKHLQYLREDVKKGDLLGELDHPDDRFDVRMKEVSHRIIDIWYDQSNKMVMGKIELLNTPNGLLAKEIVDAGIPLHISSRAAGTINKDNTVSLQQIYTYDIVAKPGFAKATLHRVAESAGEVKYNDNIKSFLEHSEKTSGDVSEGIYIDTVSKPASLRKEAIDIKEGKSNTINMSELIKHINEADNKDAQSNSVDVTAGANISVSSTDTSNKKNEGDDDADNKDDNKGDNSADADTNKDDNTNDDVKDAPFEFVSVEAIKSDDDKSDDDKSDDDKSDDDKSDDDKSDDSDADDSNECADKKDVKKNNKKDDKSALYDKLTVGLKEKEKSFLQKMEAIKNTLEKKKDINESIKQELVSNYPFVQYLTESDLHDFASLTSEQKNKVKNYLVESKVSNISDMCRTWRVGLNENATQEPTWLRFATPEYRKLFEDATEVQKNNLRESAKYLILESQNEIDTFWENSGLRHKKMTQMMNESFIEKANKIAKQRQAASELGYTTDDVMFYTNYVIG